MIPSKLQEPILKVSSLRSEKRGINHNPLIGSLSCSPLHHRRSILLKRFSLKFGQMFAAVR